MRRDKATDPGGIAKLDNFIEHLAAEFSHDWDTTMDTMAPDGVSRTWGGGPFMEMLGDELDNDGRRAFYEDMTQAGGYTAFKFVAMDTERCFVGEDTYWHANCEVRVIDEKIYIPNLPEWLRTERKTR